jgi:hypothetical protein
MIIFNLFLTLGIFLSPSDAPTARRVQNWLSTEYLLTAANFQLKFSVAPLILTISA